MRKRLLSWKVCWPNINERPFRTKDFPCKTTKKKKTIFYLRYVTQFPIADQFSILFLLTAKTIQNICNIARSTIPKWTRSSCRKLLPKWNDGWCQWRRRRSRPRRRTVRSPGTATATSHLSAAHRQLVRCQYEPVYTAHPITTAAGFGDAAYKQVQLSSRYLPHRRSARSRLTCCGRALCVV